VLHPLVTDELLQRLQDVFPAAPSRSMTIRELDHLIGQQEVITYLQRLAEEEKGVPFNVEDL
jgi:hypothetical protein